VLFKRLVFHLESPAGLIFPKVARPDPLRCHGASLFEAYRRHILQVRQPHHKNTLSSVAKAQFTLRTGWELVSAGC
jgi:hypothetical protein